MKNKSARRTPSGPTPRQPERKKTPRGERGEPRPRPETTTLWDFPSRTYGGCKQGSSAYPGATPAHVIWNLLSRYTEKGDLIVDPMAGSGTTLDVARELGRRALGYDLAPTRPDIFRVDARRLPLEDGKANFVFIDPPYSTHIDYSSDPRCIGKLDAADMEYYDSMRQVIGEIRRILVPGGFTGLYVSDSYVKGKGFHPIGFRLFGMLEEVFEPVDTVSVVRHNRTLDMGNYRRAAEEGNFFLRGFNYLFIMRKPVPKKTARRTSGAQRGGRRGPSGKNAKH
jgi:DNA modification methylase